MTTLNRRITADQMTITVEAVAYHRNGISGEGFHVVLFDWRDEGTTRHMVATVFEGAGQIAVLDRDQTAAGNVAFARGNSWRGDDFETAVRRALLPTPEAADA